MDISGNMLRRRTFYYCGAVRGQNFQKRVSVNRCVCISYSLFMHVIFSSGKLLISQFQLLNTRLFVVRLVSLLTLLLVLYFVSKLLSLREIDRMFWVGFLRRGSAAQISLAQFITLLARRYNLIFTPYLIIVVYSLETLNSSF
jgi:hypothetical protein